MALRSYGITAVLELDSSAAIFWQQVLSATMDWGLKKLVETPAGTWSVKHRGNMWTVF